MHGVINRALGNCHTFQSKLSNLVDCATNHFISLPQRFGKSIKRKLKSYRDYAIKKLENIGFDVLSLCEENCSCEEDLYNSMVYWL